PRRNSFTNPVGASATLWSGTIDRPCTAATRLIMPRAGSCIAPRSRDRLSRALTAADRSAVKRRWREVRADLAGGIDSRPLLQRPLSGFDLAGGNHGLRPAVGGRLFRSCRGAGL